MPLFLHEDISPNGEFGIWEVLEHEDFFRDQLILTQQEESLLKEMLEKRRREWLAGRYLLHKMSGRFIQADIVKDQFGKPHLPDSEFDISLSHSGRFVAAIASPKLVGIDIQRLTTKLSRIERKFMTNEDSKWLSVVNHVEHLHVCWGAKESLYKAYGRKKLEFREHILIDPFEYDVTFGQAKGYVKKLIGVKGNEDWGNIFKTENGIIHVNMEFDIYYRMIENYILVYAIQKK